MSAGSSSQPPGSVDVAVRAGSSDRESYDHLPVTEWCPHTVDLIRKQFTPETAAFLFSLPRKPAALRDHSACTRTRCTANDTNLAEGGTYKSAHWKSCIGCSECQFLGPNAQQVRNIIENGGIPLISIRRDNSWVLRVDVVRATVKSKFFAVSHVWSGGLGNPHDNSLPLCQVQRLFDMWPELTGSQGWTWRSSRTSQALFWIDTLCIPVGQEYNHLKMRAINSMAKTYASAQAIVILDHELQQIKHLGKSVSELLGLLACSAWMSRCWTFQEGAMARNWLVQFDDGIFRPDNDLNSSDSGAVLFELRKLLGDVPRLSTIRGHRRFDLKSFEARCFLFLKVWNGLCTRSTAKSEDLISIIAILLGFRPAGLLELPANRRLLSLICTQDVLPLSLMYRERPALKDWSEACQWLPSTIEEVPIDISGDVLWRRTPLDDFFVLKLSPIVSTSGYQKTRLYFTQTSSEPYDSTLRLIDEDTNEHISIKLKLSNDLRLPQLNICLAIQCRSTQVDTSSFEGAVSGACLGVRYQGVGFVQLYYICPVSCEIFPQGHLDDPVQSTDPVAIVKQEDLAGTTEYAIEYNFSKTKTLSERRPFFDEMLLSINIRVLFFPFVASVAFYILTWLSICLLWSESLTLALVPGGILVARLMWFMYEYLYLLIRNLREAEFEEWYSELYEDKSALNDTTFYIHYRPSITYSIIGLGVLFLPVFFLGKGLPAERVMLFTAWFVETEVGVLLVKWLLELYASTSPRIFNLPLRLVSMTSSDAITNITNRKIQWYFRQFYAKSRLTIFLGRVLDATSSVVPFRKHRVSNSFDSRSEFLTRDIPSPVEACEHATEPSKSAAVPWIDRDVKTFGLSTNAQKLRFANSLSGLTLRGNAPGNLDEAQRYLNGLLVMPYLYLACYWFLVEVLTLTMVLSFKGLNNNTIGAACCFCLIMCFVLLVKVCLAATSAEADVPSSVTARFSIHFRTTTTALLLGFSLPLSTLLLRSQTLPRVIVAISLCAAYVVGDLTIRWLIELLGHYHVLYLERKSVYWEGELGIGNEALDECYRRLFSKSRLTRWVEYILRTVSTELANWWRWIATWRYSSRSNYNTAAAHEEGRGQTSTGVRGAYTDDRDEHLEGDLLLLDVED